MSSEIRSGQLIAPFGPGSIYTDKNGVPIVICGLDFWFTKENGERIETSNDALKRSIITEPRLTELLNVKFFRRPPEYFYDKENPEISNLLVQGHRFPRWYVNNVNGKLQRFNLERKLLYRPEQGAWRPVRFIAVCESGHMSDFPWKEWAGCLCHDSNNLILNDSGGGDLGSIKVRCDRCKQSRSLAGSTIIRRENETICETGLSEKGIKCAGERPWLGESARQDGCRAKIAGVLINQSNIYFSNTVSSIFLPQITSDSTSIKIQDIFSRSDEETGLAKILLSLGQKEQCVQRLRELITENWDSDEAHPEDELIFDIFQKLGKGEVYNSFEIDAPQIPDSELLAFRRAEYNILRNNVEQGKSTELRVLPSSIPKSLSVFFNKIQLVEKLRETRVFFGFDRILKNNNPLDGMPDKALNQLFLKPPPQDRSWLPAVKNYGEGIYIELSEPAIENWLKVNCSCLQERFTNDIVNRMINEPMLVPPSSNANWQWAARYQLVHTLAHVLINQVVFECGYSSAALKERLFVSNDPKAPMAGFLIYTASGDSEGSLGGLVRLGRQELFENMFKRALSRASWCSADPICSENLGGSGTRQINLAACHACILLPETACETINNGLDRATVVGTPENDSLGYFSELLKTFEVHSD